MSAELALVSGLGVVAYLLLQTSKNLKEEESQENAFLFALSWIFVIGMQYTAYGIAQAQDYGNAENAYLAGLIVSLAVFGLYTAMMASTFKQKLSQNGLKGLTG